MFIDKHKKKVSNDKMNKQATIKDIAQKVGVSETTISRYLNKKYEYMSEKTRDKIETVIRELDYRPNQMARSLKSQKSRMIGAVIADIENPFSSLIIKGLSDQCEKQGYTLLIAVSDDSAVNERKHIENFLDNQVDGLVINTSGDNEEYLLALHASRLPLILLDRGVTGNQIDMVTTDNEGAVEKMLTYLVETGFQSIGFFSDKLSNSVRQDRVRSFENVLAQPKMKSIQGGVYTDVVSDESSILTAVQQFHQFPEPRVIFASNSLVTLKILEVMKSHSYQINRDFSICGFDDLAWAKVMSPSLTTIHQDSYALGAESIDQLVKKIEKKDPQSNHQGKRTLFPATLKIRESTTIKQ